MTALAEKYLRTPRPRLGPNRGRTELIGRLAGDFRIEGVVDLTWESCQLFEVESPREKRRP
ncbi:MAG: 2-hydroxyacyl-CoA dehydratase family protein [Pseudomonadota bacterium]